MIYKILSFSKELILGLIGSHKDEYSYFEKLYNIANKYEKL